MTPIQKAKEIVKSYFRYNTLNTDIDYYLDKWLATPEAAALLSGEDWINVKNRLPDEGDDVLIHMSRYCDKEASSVYCGYYNDNKKWSVYYDTGLNEDADSNQDMWFVTHWQPLPEPPKP